MANPPALATWVHLTAALVVIAHGIVWLAVIASPGGEKKRTLKPATGQAIVLGGLFSLVLYVPVLPAFPKPSIAWAGGETFAVHSACNALIGSSEAACRAGYQPKTTPVIRQMLTDRTIAVSDQATGQSANC